MSLTQSVMFSGERSAIKRRWTQLGLSQRLSQGSAVTFQRLPLAPLDLGPGGRRWGCSLHKESITQPFYQDPSKCWRHSSALLYFSSCRNVLLIKSPLVEQTDSSPIAVGHTSEIHNQQTPSTQIIPRTCKLRAMSVTGKRQTPGVQSAKSPGSYPANTVQLRTELHLPRHVWVIYFLRTWPHMGTNNSLEFGEKGDFRERYRPSDTKVPAQGHRHWWMTETFWLLTIDYLISL